MNLSNTWTSRVSTKGRRNSGSNSFLTSPSSSKVSLRLVQKTSGLFDSDKAGNAAVAGKASKAGLDLDDMDPAIAMASGESLGEIFQVPIELMEADYLDSFMDLSNFLNTGELKETESGETGEEGEEMTEKFTDFSDLHTLLYPQPAQEAVIAVAPSSPSPRKRKACEAFETCTEIKSETVTGRSVYDHDYVAKKVKKDSVEVKDMPSPSTSKAATEKTPTKYRERRDKNNVASRRSRQIRKQKFVEMDQEAERLKVTNEKLTKKIEELESLAKIMKAELIKKMTEK